MIHYYVDTCIWLNLFKKEERNKKLYWKITKEFIEQTKKKENKLLVSSIVLKEISFIIKKDFNKVMKFFKEEKIIILIKTIPEDYEFARKLEFSDNFKLSFYDYLHLSITKRLNAHLITRDNDLIRIANKYVCVNKPEELINEFI